jgi:hypothetical protein
MEILLRAFHSFRQTSYEAVKAFPGNQSADSKYLNLFWGDAPLPCPESAEINTIRNNMYLRITIGFKSEFPKPFAA